MRGNKEENKENKSEEYKYAHREFGAFNFEKSFKVPNSVDAENINAKFENGILNVVLPKKEEAVEKARADVADLLGADPREIVFTSGATESNNLALKGAAHFYSKRGKHIVTCKTEHKAVLDSCRQLDTTVVRGSGMR